MGDRAIVLMSDKNGRHDVACYLHWNGEDVIDFIQGARDVMRRGDASYSMARFIGYCHTQIEGNLSLGCFAIAPSMRLEDVSDGCAGAIVYDCSTGIITISRDSYLCWRNGENIGVPIYG